MTSDQISPEFSGYRKQTKLSSQANFAYETTVGGAVTRYSLVEIYLLTSKLCGDSLLMLILSCAVRIAWQSAV